MLKPIILSLLSLTCLVAWAADDAVLLYRYVDDKGVVVLNRQGVPPQFIGNGYQVLNDQGRVIREIPPAPSEAEMKRLLEEKARASSDRQLLRLYTSAADVERAKARKLAELDSVIGVARGNLQSLRAQQANLQSQAAGHERAGRQVPPHLITQIENLKREQQSRKRDIERYQRARAEAEKSFEADRLRIVELLGRAD